MLLNVSTRRLGLLLAEPVVAGDWVVVFPPHPALGKAPARTVRVLRVEAWSGHRWLAACELVRPLTEAEIRDFLA